MICYRSKVQVRMQIQIKETLRPFSNTHCVHWEEAQCLTWLLAQPLPCLKGRRSRAERQVLDHTQVLPGLFGKVSHQRAIKVLS